MIFIADLIACSTCFGHHYAHHQELESIIQVVAACGILCFYFQVVGIVWSWGLCVRYAGRIVRGWCIVGSRIIVENSYDSSLLSLMFFSVWPSLEPFFYVLADVIFVMWTGYTGSRYFSILRRVLKRRQFSASRYNLPLLARVYNFVWNVGSNDDRSYSVSCIANTVFTLKEICTRWDTSWWITLPLYPLKVE